MGSEKVGVAAVGEETSQVEGNLKPFKPPEAVGNYSRERRPSWPVVRPVRAQSPPRRSGGREECKAWM